MTKDSSDMSAQTELQTKILEDFLLKYSSLLDQKVGRC